MNCRGQMAVWEGIIILVLMGACGYMFYLYAHKPSENQIFQNGSKPQIREIRTAPFSCVREGSLDAITNSQTHH